MSEKKFKEITGAGIEGNYWKPTSIGTTIEGTILQFEEGEYGTQTTITTTNNDTIELPAHKDLQNKLQTLTMGDYIRITLQDFKKSNNPEYNDKTIYKVEVAINQEETEGEILDDY